MDSRISFDSIYYFYINVRTTGKIFRWSSVWGFINSKHDTNMVPDIDIDL